MRIRSTLIQTLIVLFTLLFIGCGQSPKPEEKDIVALPEQLDVRVARDIAVVLAYARENDGMVADSSRIRYDSILQVIYNDLKFQPLWSANGNWNHIADTLLRYIKSSYYDGLFPSDYHLHALQSIQSEIARDSVASKDAMLWTRADILMSDALLRICNDLSRGRISYDTLNSGKDTQQLGAKSVSAFEGFRKSGDMFQLKAAMEPAHKPYQEMKQALQAFLDSADLQKITYLKFPLKDSIAFYRQLHSRLRELSIYSDSIPANGDTQTIRLALQKFQLSKKLKPTGVANAATIDSLNMSDIVRFQTIAISLDKLKLLPDTLPATYVWVNIPAYSMKLVESDSVVLRSRVIVGTPKTRTPELTSEISNFVIYPQWTVPYSIVFKEMVPQIIKDTNYLIKQNLMIVDVNDNLVSAASIDWKKANKNNFPYQIKQRQGDDNSLGILKFNFRNKYSVYLHDTNARWLFGRSFRALSHGCVRVQKWRELADYLVRNDTIRFPKDSLDRWLSLGEKKTISGFRKVPVYLRYYTCDTDNGIVRFYPDIYAEDKVIREKYFLSKSIN